MKLPEKIKQNQVEGHKHADKRAFHQKHQKKIFLDAELKSY
jgi:hypothetical protein